MNKEEIFQKTKVLLAKSLDIEEAQITMEQYLFHDYGIESTEILEITFRIEQEFGFTMGEGELWGVASLILNEGMFDSGFSEEAVKLVRQYVNISDEDLKSMQSPFDIQDHITIGDLVNYIEKKLS